MIVKPRYSSFFPNPLSSKLGIVHRQGQNRAWIFIALFSLFCISYFMGLARSVALSLTFLRFSVYVLAGFSLYIFLTLVLRKWFYYLVLHFQGILHPKLLVTLGVIIISLTISTNQSFLMIVLVTGMLVGVDVFIQNQLHDIVSTIGPNSWEINCLLPVFQIPFERDIRYNLGDENQYYLSMRYHKPLFTKSRGIIHGIDKKGWVNPTTVDDFLASVSELEIHGTISLYLVEPPGERNRNKIEVYETLQPMELKELLVEIHNLVNIELIV